MKLDEFNKNYIYQPDKERFNTSLDIWEIAQKDSDGKYRGDCESYCRFLKNNVEQFKDWDYYYCKIRGMGHCVLVKDDKVIDCNVRSIADLDTYRITMDMTELHKFSWFIIFSKIIVTNIYLVFK